MHNDAVQTICSYAPNWGQKVCNNRAGRTGEATGPPQSVGSYRGYLPRCHMTAPGRRHELCVMHPT